MKIHWDCYERAAKFESARWAVTDRGWLFIGGHPSAGNYLDYGPDHYRSGHEYCRGDCTCRLSQPGNVHAVVYGIGSRYFETVDQAKAWIESEALRLRHAA
jgi:hypothetical protein